MEALRLPSREEIHSAYVEGEEAVVVLTAGLAANWVSVVQEQQQTIQALTMRIEVPENQLSKNSSNSGKPPSSDRYKKPAPRSLRQRHGKKSGGQFGHPGHTLTLRAAPEQVQVHGVESCPHCHHNLADVPAHGCERRQVFDLPLVRKLAPMLSATSVAISRLHAKTASACSIRYTWLCLAHPSFLLASPIVPRQQPEQLPPNDISFKRHQIYHCLIDRIL